MQWLLILLMNIRKSKFCSLVLQIIECQKMYKKSTVANVERKHENGRILKQKYKSLMN